MAKPGWVPVRLGLAEHIPHMTPMEVKIYLAQLIIARRSGPHRGIAFTNMTALSKIVGHKREHVRRAIRSLESMGYLKQREDGWQIINFNGDSPVGVARKGTGPKGATGPKGVKRWPEKGQRGGPKADTRVARKGAVDAANTQETLPHTPALDDKKTYKKTGEGSKSSAGAAAWRATTVTWDDYREGVKWDDDKQEVALSEFARTGLREHLEAVAAEEGLAMLTKAQLQEGWGRLSTHLIAEWRKRGPKTLPGIVRGWFTNDLRRCGRGPPGRRQGRCEPKGFAAIREVFGEVDDGK